MIKINKDLLDIPTSLKPSTADFFILPSRPSTQSKKTHQRRQELVDNGAYIDHINYNNRYKLQDIKESLNDLYKNKCAFCEQRIEVPHVEHFRPKAIYYWLTYSWDNLLLACSACNTNKGKKFDLMGVQYQFVFDLNSTYQTIHSSCSALNRTERPLLVNPEVEDLTSELIFDQYGGVSSNHARVSHTIECCDLSRDDLKYQRKKLIDDFKKDIEAALLSDDTEVQKNEISAFFKQFLRRINSSEESFLAFRRYAINNNWLAQIIKDLN